MALERLGRQNSALEFFYYCVRNLEIPAAIDAGFTLAYQNLALGLVFHLLPALWAEK